MIPIVDRKTLLTIALIYRVVIIITRHKKIKYENFKIQRKQQKYHSAKNI